METIEEQNSGWDFTNFDKLKMMNREQLNDWFTSVCTGSVTGSCSGCPFDELYCTFMEWLGQKVEL